MMKTFEQFLLEARDLDLSRLKKAYSQGRKIYILVGGTLGAGKTTWVKNNLPEFEILDTDDFSMKLAGGSVDPEDLKRVSSQALADKKKAVSGNLYTGRSFVDMGTSANTGAAIDKIKTAKKLGYLTVYLHFMTTPEEAKRRNRERIASGGRGVVPEKEFKIDRVYHDAMFTLDEMKSIRQVDFILEVDN